MTTYFLWVSAFEGVISEARGYASEEELWAGLLLFVSEYMGGDVSESYVTGFRIDLVTGETAVIAVDQSELERIVGEGDRAKRHCHIGRRAFDSVLRTARTAIGPLGVTVQPWIGIVEQVGRGGHRCPRKPYNGFRS